MNKILVTGMPYSGKSYISNHLVKKGENVFDIDKLEGVGAWFDKSKKQVDFPSNASKEWLSNHDFLWNKESLKLWLQKQNKSVYLFGIAVNIFDIIPLFDKVYYLDIDINTLKSRFLHNERSNPMGTTKVQQEAIIKDLEGFRNKAEERGLIFIKADQSPEEIFKIIEN